MTRTNNRSNKERKVQDVGDEDIMYEPLLDDIAAETLMNEADFQIYTGSWDGLQGVKQEDFILKDEGKLAAREKPGTSGEEQQVDGSSRHKRTVVTTTKEATIFECGHMVIDSTNETTYP